MGLREPDEIKMAWTEITRAQYQRDDLEYASDLRDAEWALIAPLMPERKWTCDGFVPICDLFYAASASKASGLILPR